MSNPTINAENYHIQMILPLGVKEETTIFNEQPQKGKNKSFFFTCFILGTY